MTYRNLKAIIKAMPIEEWVKVDIEKSVDDFIKDNLTRWLELLSTDGCNSKSIVANDIQYCLFLLNSSKCDIMEGKEKNGEEYGRK